MQLDDDRGIDDDEPPLLDEDQVLMEDEPMPQADNGAPDTPIGINGEGTGSAD